MTRLTILEYPDPRLRTRAAPVARVDDEIRRLVDDMLETMYAAKGVGLAATQVNVPLPDLSRFDQLLSGPAAGGPVSVFFA